MTLEALQEILAWVLPPLLGAIIGFITNAIAIKMLFRPLTEKRLFGLKIPLTPGIIPRQRFELADSIGNMVYEKLITYETLKKHITTEDFKEGLLRNISGLTSGVIYKPVSDIDKEKLKLFYNSLEQLLNRTLKNLFGSENFHEFLKKSLDGLLDSISAARVESLIKDTKLKEILASYVLPFLTGNRMKSLISRQAGQWIDNQVGANTPLAEIVPESFIETLTTIFRSFLPDLVKSLFAWLRTPEMTHLLETQGRVLLKNILDRLDFMQKLLVSMGQYDKTLEKQMPKIVEDALKSVEEGIKDPDNQHTFVESVKQGIMNWEKNGVTDLFITREANIQEKVDALVDKIFDAVGSENTREHLLNSIDDFLADNKERSLRDILEKEFEVNIPGLSDYFFKYILKYISEGDSVTKLSTRIVELVVEILNKMEDKSIGTLFNIGETIKNKMDNFLLEKIYELLDAKLPEFVESFNVKELVVNKINSLQIEEVEKLLLMVIEKHLKWINVFGALLGSLLGFIQVALRLIIK